MKVETKEMLWEYFSAGIMLAVSGVVILCGLGVLFLVGGMFQDLANINWSSII
jgi:hypothetical protein